MLVVAAITTFISTFLILSFARARIDLAQTANLIVSDVRDAQTRVIANSQYNSTHRCGYGVTTGATPQSYRLYVGPDTSNANCQSENRNFDANDTIIRTVSLPDARLEIKQATPFQLFFDIFFEPPNPTTFINNVSSGAAPGRILIGPVGKVCDAKGVDCKAICVYASGKIELPATLICPAN